MRSLGGRLQALAGDGLPVSRWRIRSMIFFTYCAIGHQGSNYNVDYGYGIALDKPTAIKEIKQGFLDNHNHPAESVEVTVVSIEDLERSIAKIKSSNA
jgi:hypothetical protein